jgi:hypothetical protein
MQKLGSTHELADRQREVVEIEIDLNPVSTRFFHAGEDLSAAPNPTLYLRVVATVETLVPAGSSSVDPYRRVVAIHETTGSWLTVPEQLEVLICDTRNCDEAAVWLRRRAGDSYRCQVCAELDGLGSGDPYNHWLRITDEGVEVGPAKLDSELIPPVPRKSLALTGH